MRTPLALPLTIVLLLVPAGASARSPHDTVVGPG
jgi:hypothetical protein